jgi:hypothetical protein
MKLLFTLILVGALFFATACIEKNKVEELSGFWVSADYEPNKAFNTLTIKDSVLEINRYGTYTPNYALWPNEDCVEAHYPFDGWYTAFVLFVDEDTLTQVHGYKEANERKIKYVRMDSLSIDRKLLYCDSPLKIDLPDAGEKNGWVPIVKKSLVSSLYVGRVKRGNMSEFPGVSIDSVAIQRDDVLIPFSGIETFLKNEQAKLDELDRENLIILLHADKETPEQFTFHIRELVRKYNPKLRVCKAFVNWPDRAILYDEIK